MTVRPMRDRTGPLWPALLFFMIPLALHAPIWSGRIDFFSGPASDLIPYVQGLKALQYQTIHRCGELPLWNPHLLFGQPVVGNIQHALFYPLNAIFWLFPFFTAAWVSQALHMTLAGWGAWMLARRAGCGPLDGGVAGVLYMVNGRILYYINAGWAGYLHAICWLPLILWAALGVMDRRNTAASTQAGVLLSLCLLSGTPQYAFMAFILTALHAVAVSLRPRPPMGRSVVAGRLAWAGLIFMVLSAIQIFPSVEQAYLSSRPLSAGQSMGFHFDWNAGQWIRILLRPEFLAHDHAWELCGYIGIGGLALALVGIVAAGHSFGLTVVIWGLLPVLLSMGPAVPWLDRWIQTVPGLTLLVSPSRYFIFTVLILCVAAGRGLQSLLDGLRKKRPVAAWGAVLVCLALAGAVLVPTEATAGRAEANSRLLGAVIVSAMMMTATARRPKGPALWLLILWLAADPLLLAPRLLTGHRSAELAPPKRIQTALADHPDPVRVAVIQPERLRNNLVSVLPDPDFVIAGLDRVGAYEPLSLLRSLRFVSRMDGAPPPDRAMWGIRPFGLARPELFRIAGVTHLLFTREQTHPLLRLVAEDRVSRPDFHGGRWRHQAVYLYALNDPLPRAFFLARGHGRPDPVAPPASSSPNRRRLTPGKPVPGRLVLSETFHRGWQARIDGRSGAVIPFLDTFLSVELPAGARRVDLTFLPQSYVTGRRVSAAGLIFLVLLAAFRLYRFRRAHHRRSLALG